MQFQRIVAFTMLMAIASTCTYPVADYQSPGIRQFFVVDASISDSLSEVRLSVSSSSTQIFNYFTVKKAKVFLTDSFNRTYTIPEVSNGYYKAVQALTSGQTYELHIIREDGSQYESLPETMPQVTPIDTIFYRFDQKTNFPEGSENRNGFNVYVHFKDSDKNGEYYQWSWVHYERAGYCGMYVDFQGNDIYNPCIPDCWSRTTTTKQILLSDELKNGKNLEMLVERVPYYNNPTKYYLMVEQRAITKNAYTYFASLKSQNETNGTPFDIPPQTRFSLNIHSLSNPNEKIIGIFNLFSSKKRLIYINRDVVNVIPLRTPYRVFCSRCELPCTESDERTKIKPAGWED